ncbi:MAG: hypothetical protein H6502_03325 [Candidatus Woesearchaeota archaeon]|nr:MAG: hypothetical protein H6502_03325 [Candidatus Woesearchaeota archaeon]
MAKKRIEYPINETFVIIAVGAILLLAAVFTFAAQVNPPQVIFRVSHEELFTDRIEPYADPGTIINADLSLEEISADAITLGGERRTTWPQADEGCSITSLTSSLAVGAQQSLLSFPTACSQGACSFRAVLTRNQGVVSFAQKNVWGTIHPFPVREGELQTTSKRVVSLYVMYGSANPVQLQKNSFIIDLPSQPGTNTVFSVAQTQGSCSLTYEESGEWRFTAIENANFFQTTCKLYICT